MLFRSGSFLPEQNAFGEDLSVYTGGVGWEDVDDPHNGNRLNGIHRAFSTTTLTALTLTYDATATADDTGDSGLYIDATKVANGPTVNGTNQTFAWTGSMSGSKITCVVNCKNNPGVGTSTQKTLVISGTGDNPFGGAGSAAAQTRLSGDYGATFAAADVIGTNGPGGPGGFDITRSSATAYGAANAAVYKATTLGGA